MLENVEGECETCHDSFAETSLVQCCYGSCAMFLCSSCAYKCELCRDECVKGFPLNFCIKHGNETRPLCGGCSKRLCGKCSLFIKVTVTFLLLRTPSIDSACTNALFDKGLTE